MENKPVEVLNASAGGWGIGNELGYLTSRGTFDANIVAFVLNTGDPSQPTAETAPELNYPRSRPRTAIGEAWCRYALPRILARPDPKDSGTTLPPPDQEAKVTAENMQLLTQAHEFCEKHGAAFCVVYVPFAGMGGAFADRARFALSKWTHDEHAPFIDVSPAFAGQSIAALTFDGLHLRPYGDELVAREIARQWKTIVAGRNSTRP